MTFSIECGIFVLQFQEGVVNIPDRLKSIRESKGFSVSKLAKLAHVSRQTIYNLENGKRNFAWLKTLRALADALDVKITDFFTE